MIIVSFIATDEDEWLIPGVKYVDYGVTMDTLEKVLLPTEPYREFVIKNCYFDEDIQEYILKEYI